jgi:hypothetical protein
MIPPVRAGSIDDGMCSEPSAWKDLRVLSLQATVSVALVLGAFVGNAASETRLDETSPPAPTPPEVVSRDSHGRATVRAVAVREPIVVDGLMEERLYREVPAIDGFVQQEPHEGAPATERTEVWLAYDVENVYVSARLWDSHPERIVANELRRDNRNIFHNDNFAVILDTFYDRRNGFLFHTNPLGALYDAQVTDEGNTNSDWNTVWEVKTSRFDQGWIVEMALPFKSLRYGAGENPIWGVNFRRIVRSKNEWSYLTPIPAAFRSQGILKLSHAASLVGIETPRSSLNFEWKPYVTSGVRTDRNADVPFENAFDSDVGLDAKYGLTKSLVADFTMNTDFAQVEADDEQVNLERFSLFFPEKREFFLEGQGIFAFGGSTGRRFGGPQDVPILFFSRRIGLEDGFQVPIRAGARMTGRSGRYTLGLLSIQTEGVEETSIEPTNFSVVRLKRDLLRRSNIGVLATHRSLVYEGEGSNSVLGVDANFSFFQNLDINSFYAKTSSPGVPDGRGDDYSYFAKMEYDGDRYGVSVSHLAVGDEFEPEIGFVRRSDIRKSAGSLRFSPRPQVWSSVRKIDLQARFEYFENGMGQVETKELQLEYQTDFQNGDDVSFEFSRSFEGLFEDFEITEGVTIPVGGYEFDRIRVNYRMGPQRPFTGRVNASTGGFFGGSRTEIGCFGRVEISEKLSLEPDISQNWVEVPQGPFTTTLLRLRGSYTLSARSVIGALVQYNTASQTLTTNVRYRWEYRPGSELFVVYSDGRDTMNFDRSDPAMRTQSLVIKFTRLFRL